MAALYRQVVRGRSGPDRLPDGGTGQDGGERLPGCPDRLCQRSGPDLAKPWAGMCGGYANWSTRRRSGRCICRKRSRGALYPQRSLMLAYAARGEDAAAAYPRRLRRQRLYAPPRGRTPGGCHGRSGPSAGRAWVAVLGYAHLEESDDTRNSPTEALIKRLRVAGAGGGRPRPLGGGVSGRPLGAGPEP